jgi:hypothetical protein
LRFRSRVSLQLEVRAFRHQLAVLRRRWQRTIAGVTYRPAVAFGRAQGLARAPAGINLRMLMDGRQALPLHWKEQQMIL